MGYSSIITPKVVTGYVSRQTNLGVNTYDLDELYSPSNELWKSKVLDLGSPKYSPQSAAAPTRYWFDRSRYNNHGTITGATWKQLPSGLWVLDFDGTNDNVHKDSAVSSIGGGTALTIEMWYNSDGYNGVSNIMFFAVGNTAGNNSFFFQMLTTSKLACYVYGVGSYIISWESTNNYSINSWKHLVISYNNAPADVYLDGISWAGTDVGVQGTVPSPTTYLSFGAGWITSAYTQFFDGKIALARIYSRALSANEVAQHYSQERHLFNV